MFDISLEGLDEFEKLLKDLENEELKNITAVVYNNSAIATVIEYGSIPKQDPWPGAGSKTSEVSDVETGVRKIASKGGFAPLRGNLPKTLKKLTDNYKQLDISKPVRPQLVKLINNTAYYLFNKAKNDTPSGSGVIEKEWKVKQAN